MLYLTFGQPIVVGFAISQKVLFNSSDIEKSWLSPFRFTEKKNDTLFDPAENHSQKNHALNGVKMTPR